MKKIKEVLKKFITKIKNILLYIAKGILIIIFALMFILPFIIKNITFEGDDLVVFNTTIPVISISGKVNVKILDTYVKTDISYDKYDNYISSYKKSKPVKKVMVLELFLLFILLEASFLYFILNNIIKLYIEPEEDPYKKYVINNSFCINNISLFLISFIRRFLFRNTVFSSLSISLTIMYIFIILMLLVYKKIIDQNKVSIFKRKKNAKN